MFEVNNPLIIYLLVPNLFLSIYLGLKDFFFRAENPFLATVAIDLGTAYSGFAYSLNKNQGEDAIFMNRDWVNELGHRTSKTPTCLLLKSDLTFDSFGYKAVERYAYFRSVYEAQDVFLQVKSLETFPVMPSICK